MGRQAAPAYREEGLELKYIFCSSIYDMDDYEKLSSKSKIPLSLADHNLNRNIILGLDEATGVPVQLINNVQIPSYPTYPRVFFRKKAWRHTPGAEDIHCGFINLPVLKHLSRAITTFSAIKKAVKAAPGEDICLLTYDVRLGIALAMGRAKRKFSNIRTCIVMPDVPTEVLAASTGGKISFKAKMWAKVKMRFIRRFDSYVFVAEPMKEVVDVRKKPYTVVEGIYNNHQPPLDKPTTDKKVIFYSGQLNPAYGMENLLEAFVEIYKDHPEIELWLCGNGRLVPKIRELAANCPGIQFYGYVSGERVRQLQAQATVLVNPRQNVGGLTRFSFPSKTMEYLASGRPVLGYRLDGIPREYDEYIQYVGDNSLQALQDKLLEICSLSAEKREQIGEKSRKFILENKNPKKQCSKIVAMVNGMFEG